MIFVDDTKIAKQAVQEALDRDNKIVMTESGNFYEIPVSIQEPDGWRVME